uniref:Uncharacterized protein n=5 Tax=Triticinae TaxID=1648030 RepID=A0A453B6M2_AEGTS
TRPCICMYYLDRCGDQTTAACLILAPYAAYKVGAKPPRQFRFRKALSLFHPVPRQYLQNSPWSGNRVVLERWMAAICWVLQELIERGGTRPRSSRWRCALAMLLLLLLTAAAAVSMAPDGPARLHALFCSNHFVMMCVLSQINLACLFARKAARARTLAARRFYAVGAAACFVELALKPYRIRLLCHAAVEDDA